MFCDRRVRKDFHLVTSCTRQLQKQLSEVMSGWVNEIIYSSTLRRSAFCLPRLVLLSSLRLLDAFVGFVGMRFLGFAKTRAINRCSRSRASWRFLS